MALLESIRGPEDVRRLERDQLTRNTDYQGTGGASQKRLNREQTDSGDDHEIVWSAGETLTADAVLKAFRLGPAQSAALQRDALPTFSGASLLAKIFFWAFIVSLMLFTDLGIPNDPAPPPPPPAHDKGRVHDIQLRSPPPARTDA